MNLYAKAYWSNNPIPVNQQINNPDFIINVPIGVIVGSGDVTKSYVDQQDAALSAQIDTKLDASDYVQHFRGVFVNLAALQAAIPVGINGDYAHIDLGVGFDRKVAIWDTDDNKWIESTGSIALTTDEVTEGNANKYFTDLRVRNTVLSGLVKTDSSNVTNTDTVEVAVGKLAAKSEAGGSGGTTTWVNINTLTGYTKNVNVSDSGTTIEVAKFDGLLWIRGFISTTNSISINTELFGWGDTNYLWDYVPRNSTFTYDTLLNRFSIFESVDYQMRIRQNWTGTGSHRLRFFANQAYGAAIGKGVIPPTPIGKSLT